MQTTFNEFCSKSFEFREALLRETKNVSTFEELKHKDIATLILADISSEHGHAIHILAKNRCSISASSLLRLQFESLLRAKWLYWVASNDVIERFNKPLTEQNVKQAEKRIPTINVILSELEVKVEEGKVPKKALMLMQEFKNMALKASNSYVHSGMHAFSRRKDGFPEPLMIQILQNSNGLEALKAMLLATLVESNEIMQEVVNLQYIYLDCLPMHTPEIMDRFYGIS